MDFNVRPKSLVRQEKGLPQTISQLIQKYKLDALWDNIQKIVNEVLQHADFIRAGEISADRIKGGTLKLGGENNISGKLKVVDESGNGIVDISKDGFILENGTKIIGSDGLISNLQFGGVVSHNSYKRTNEGAYDTLGFEVEEVVYGENRPTLLIISPVIPKGFTIVSAIVNLRHYPLKILGLGAQHMGWGYCRNLKLYYRTNARIYGEYGMYEGIIPNVNCGTEIQNAFGGESYTPSVPTNSLQKMDVVSSVDVSEYFSEDNDVEFIIKSTDIIDGYTGDTDIDYLACALKTGMVQATLDIIGYFKEEE